MRKKLKKAILLLFAALAALLIFAGCELGMTPEQAKDAYDIKATVTYYANGGTFGNGIEVQELWYQNNSRPMNIGQDIMTSGTTSSFNLKRDNYEFKGWYHIIVDEETGEPIADEETGECTLDMEKPVDFNTQLVEGDEWHIGAYWRMKAKVRVRLVSDGVITDKSGNTFDPEAEGYIAEFNYGLDALGGYKTGMDVANNKSPIDLVTGFKATHVFAGYYFDEACTQPVVTEIYLEDNQEEDLIVYAKYLTKDWTVVWNSKTAKQMFEGMWQEDQKYFVARDIVMSAADKVAVTDLAATVDGNGCTISGVTVLNKEVPNGKDTALFGRIAATAKMKDLTFENVSVTYATKGRGNFYFVCSGIDEAAQIENVTVSGSMEVSDNSAENLDDGAEDCIFGGFATDVAYMEANPNGFKIKNMSLKYNTRDFVEIIKDFVIIN